MITTLFTRGDVEEILNLQPKGNKAKNYQVKQVRNLFLKYKIGREAMNSKYEIILYWSQEDDAYIAEVPELPGCMADGATYQEALQNAETVIAEWIETAIELNRSIPEPKGKLMYA